MEKKKLYEADLYEPVRRLFVREGYEVNGEVKDCDLTAVKEEELIIVEMKKNLTVELLIQAANRQKLTDLVFIAIPKPKYKMYSKKWHDMCHLLKRLELGLIIVSFLKSGAKAEIILSPAPFDRKRTMQMNKKKRLSLLTEINGRSGDYNIGGSNKTKIMTAYKENCIQIACYLDREGPTSPKTLRKMGTGEKTLSILTQNYYGWFEKVSRGIYTITEKGKEEIKQYPELLKHYLN
ncbi:DUF2161 domain-containing phosphodiesterase [Heyndrickxia camelliae]|uniref:Uncharacterized protein n=1 Tax=Heyndrickxia camelliae TaxID=1707093 RepID=A0A2N3LJ81_9BACI|nr:DUF2161 family putative PD-(D/E)XK-type phosphodiesterase [Heyndrickxia camelliae]PKR84624.1 hypothetical protein CWO92_13005 [Heyndrickxia camelliae]